MQPTLVEMGSGTIHDNTVEKLLRPGGWDAFKKKCAIELAHQDFFGENITRYEALLDLAAASPRWQHRAWAAFNRVACYSLGGGGIMTNGSLLLVSGVCTVLFVVIFGPLIYQNWDGQWNH
jgi:hypothetical protein